MAAQIQTHIPNPAGNREAIAQPGSAERRILPRFPLDEAVLVHPVAGAASFRGRISDLSAGGCRLEIDTRLLTGAMLRVELQFRISGISFRLAGVTAGRRTKTSLGIRFVDLNERRRTDLAEVLSDLAAAASKEHPKGKTDASVASVASPPEPEQQTPPQKRTFDVTVRPEAARPTSSQTVQVQPIHKQPVSARSVTVQPTLAPLAAAKPTAGHSAIASAGVVSASRAVDPIRGSAGNLPEKSVHIEQPNEMQPDTRQSITSVAGEVRERRAFRRLKVDTRAQLHLVKTGICMPGAIQDLSMAGCRIVTTEPFNVGIYVRVETEFFLHGLPFRLGGVSQAIINRNTIGVRFLDMSERKREQLAELIEEIRAALGEMD